MTHTVSVSLRFGTRLLSQHWAGLSKLGALPSLFQFHAIPGLLKKRENERRGLRRERERERERESVSCLFATFYRTAAVIAETPIITFFSSSSSFFVPMIFFFTLVNPPPQKKQNKTELTVRVLKKDPNTQEIKRTLINWTKQDKTCQFSRKSSFSSYVEHKNRKTKNSIYLVSVRCSN